MFAALAVMWSLVVAEFGYEACDQGDTLYWYWQSPALLSGDSGDRTT